MIKKLTSSKKFTNNRNKKDWRQDRKTQMMNLLKTLCTKIETQPHFAGEKCFKNQLKASVRKRLDKKKQKKTKLMLKQFSTTIYTKAPSEEP